MMYKTVKIDLIKSNFEFKYAFHIGRYGTRGRQPLALPVLLKYYFNFKYCIIL